LRRKPDAVQLPLEGRELQTRAVMSRQTRSDISQQARRSQDGSGRHGNGEEAVMSRPTTDVAHEARSSHVVSGRQGTEDAGSHVSDGMGKRLRRTPDAFT
jgi:hypothetical protein